MLPGDRAGGERQTDIFTDDRKDARRHDQAENSLSVLHKDAHLVRVHDQAVSRGRRARRRLGGSRHCPRPCLDKRGTTNFTGWGIDHYTNDRGEHTLD